METKPRHYMGNVINATEGIENEDLLHYFYDMRNKMKKRHERGIVPRPEWCSPIRWRIFARWYKSREGAKAFGIPTAINARNW